MRSSIKFGLLVFSGLSTLLFGCTNKKAIEFKHTLELQEQKVTHILIGKNASESRKLEYLIAEDYDKALSVVDEQAKEFDAVLDTVKALVTKDLDKAEALKQAKLAYYGRIKSLHFYAKKEIAQQKLMHQAKGREIDEVQDELLRLVKAKKELYDKVYQAEEAVHTSLLAFDKANGL